MNRMCNSAPVHIKCFVSVIIAQDTEDSNDINTIEMSRK